MLKKIMKRVFVFGLALIMMITVVPQSILTTINAYEETENHSKTLLATVQITDGKKKYYYLEELYSTYSSCNRDWDDSQKQSCIVSYAWSDAVKQSAENKKNVTMTLYHDWEGSVYEDGHIMQAPDQGSNYYDGAFLYGIANAAGDITLDLNGYMVNRGNAGASHSTAGNGEVFRIPEGGSLTIEDSNSTRMHMGYVDSYLWFPTADASRNTQPLYGGVIAGGANSTGGGGIVVCGNATLTINGGTLAGNVSSQGGGGITASDEGADIIMNGGAISYNMTSGGHGGGIHLGGYSAKAGDGTFYMTGGAITHNYASEEITSIGGCGGGIYVNSTEDNEEYLPGSKVTVLMTGGIIGYNHSYDDGGGVFVDYGNVLLKGGLIIGNRTDSSGGGVYINGYNWLNGARQTHIMGVSIMNNNAAKNGGGFYVNAGHAELNSGTIMGNTVDADTSESSEVGSGIYVNGGYNYLALTGGTVYCQNNGYHNLYLRTYNDIDKGSLAATSVVYVSTKLSDSDRIQLTNNGVCSGISQYVLRSDYADYYVVMDGSGNEYLQKGTSPDTASSVGPEIITEGTKGESDYTEYKKIPFKYTSVLDSKIDKESSIYYSDELFSQSADNYNQQLATATMGLAMAAFRRPSQDDSTEATPAEQAQNVIDLYGKLGFSNIDVHYPTPAKTDTGYTIGYTIALKKTTIKNPDTGKPEAKYILAVAVRGANYETEWGSNTTMNDSATDDGEAKGFSNAADQVMEGIEKYISDHFTAQMQDACKIWITGYSRSGATANLTARRVIDGFDFANEKNVYAYTFEAPQGAVNVTKTDALDHTTWDASYPKYEPLSTQYSSIHNLINKSDLVPMVAPSIMGFTRYGIDHYIPGDTTISNNSSNYYASDSSIYKDLRVSMMKQLNLINNDIYFTDYFEKATINYILGSVTWVNLIGSTGKIITGDGVANYYSTMINFLLKYGLSQKFNKSSWTDIFTQKETHIYDPVDPDGEAGYRALYSNKWYVDDDGNLVDASRAGETGIHSYTMQDALAVVINLVFGLDKKTSDAATEKLGLLLDKMELTEILSLYNAAITWNYRLQDLDTKNRQRKIIWNALVKSGLEDVLGTERFNALKYSFPVILDMLMSFVSYDYNKDSYDGGTTSTANNYLLGTLAYNTTAIATQHYPEVNFAWMRAQDSLYQDDYKGFSTDPETFEKPAAPTFKQLSVSDSSSGKKIEISTETKGAQIFYTLNTNGESTTPSLETLGKETKLFGNYLSLDSDYKVRKDFTVTAVAYKDGVYSDPVTATYTVFPGADKHYATIYDNGKYTGGQYYPNEVITVSAASDDNSEFVSWSSDTKKVSFADSSCSTTTFVMPSDDVYIWSDRVYKINSVKLEFNTTGTENNEMYLDKPNQLSDSVNWYASSDDKAYCSQGYSGTYSGYTYRGYESVPVKWTTNSDGSMTAEVVLPKLVRSGQVTPEYKNGLSYSVSSDPSPTEKMKAEVRADGSLLLKIKFNLNATVEDIVYPTEIKLAHSSADDLAGIVAKAQETNPTAEVTCKNWSVVQADITLDDSLTDGTYDPTKLEEQSFTVAGSIDTAANYIRIGDSGKSATSNIKITVLAADKANPVTAEPGSKYSNSNVDITLTSEGSDHIYYTLDGSDPTTSQTRKEYTKPFTIEGVEASTVRKQLQAYATRTGYSDSIVSSYRYVISLATQQHSVTVTGGKAQNSALEDITDSNRPYTGNIVVLKADEVPAGKTFVGWTVVSGNAAIMDPSAKKTSFTMPANDVEIQANYVVNTVNFTIDKPVVNSSLATSVTGLDSCIKSSDVSVTWNPNDSTAQSDKVYTATVTLPLVDGQKYASNVSAKVTIGNEILDGVVERVDDTHIKVSYKFNAFKLTVQKKLGEASATTVYEMTYESGNDVSIPWTDESEYNYDSISYSDGTYSMNNDRTSITGTMGKADTTVTVCYTEKTAIVNPIVTMTTVPVGRKPLPESNAASTTTTGVSGVSVKWLNDAVPEYNRSCIAVFTLTPDGTHKFTDASTITVDGGTVKNKVRNSDGTLTVYVEFTTAKAVLSKIEITPTSGTYVHDTAENVASAIKKDLPGSTVLTYTDGNTDVVNLTWEKDNNAYNADIKEQQTVNYNAKYNTKYNTLPDYVDENGKTLVPYVATVSAKEKAKMPVASLKSGNYTSAQTLTLTSSQGGTVWYTLDGTDPSDNENQNRMKYTAQIAIDATQTVKACTVKDEYRTSDVATLNYTVTLPDAYNITVTGGGAINMNGTDPNYKTSLTAHEGDTILLKADDPASDQQFDKWIVTSGSEYFYDTSSDVVVFTMGKSDLVVSANYQTVVSQVAMTIGSDYWKPEQGSKMRSNVSVTMNQTIACDDTTVDWRPGVLEDGKADGGTAYTAVINVAAPSDNHVFSDTVAGTINGHDASVFKNEDGSLSFVYVFDKTAGTAANEYYSVTAQGFDGNSKEALSTSVHTLGEYKAGETVKTAAAVVSGYQFTGWTAEKNDGTIIANLSCASSSLSFTMPAYAVKLKANYVKKTEISSLAFTMNEPVIGEDLSSSISSDTEGLEWMSLTWSDLSTPTYGDIRIAEIRVEADASHMFNTESLTEDDIAVNGYPCDFIDYNDDGSMNVYAVFFTAHTKIVSVVWNDADYIVPEGTSEDTMKALLPSTASLVLDNGTSVSVPVSAEHVEGSNTFKCIIQSKDIPYRVDVDDTAPYYEKTGENDDDYVLAKTVTFAYEGDDLPQLAAPKFAYTGQTGIVLLNGVEGSTIYYEISKTDDAPSDPTVNSTPYVLPIQIEGDKGTSVTYKVRAFAVKDGYASSEVSKQEFTYTIPAEYELTVNCYDLNADKIVDRKTYTYSEGETIDLVAPNVEDEAFYGWKDGTQFNTEVACPTTAMPANDVELTAAYVPVVNKISTTVTDPILGSDLSTEAGQTMITITNQYEISAKNMQIEWMPDTGVAENYGYAYTAKITLKMNDDGQTINMRKKGTRAWSSAAPVFGLTDETVLTVNGQKAILYQDGSDFVGYYTVRLANAVLGAEPALRPIQLSYLNGTDRSAFDLPDNTDIVLTDGSTVNVPIIWTYGDYDSYLTADQTVNAVGTICLPENISNLYGYKLTFERTLNISSAAYVFTKGMNSSWILGSQEELYFEINAPLGRLEKIMIDGMTLTEGTDYRTESGSTRLWISPAYLNQLLVGTHRISAYYTGYDGPVAAEFTIEKAKEEYNEIVDTGAPGLNNWILMLGLSSLMAAGCLILLRKNKAKFN
jgi:hypothetical protein